MSNIKIGQRRQANKGKGEVFKILEKHQGKNGQQQTYTVQLEDRTTKLMVKSRVQSSKVLSRY